MSAIAVHRINLHLDHDLIILTLLQTSFYHSNSARNIEYSSSLNGNQQCIFFATQGSIHTEPVFPNSLPPNDVQLRIHWSRMRTARLLAVCVSMNCW